MKVAWKQVARNAVKLLDEQGAAVVRLDGAPVDFTLNLVDVSPSHVKAPRVTVKDLTRYFWDLRTWDGFEVPGTVLWVAQRGELYMAGLGRLEVAHG